MSVNAIKEAERARESHLRRGRPLDTRTRVGALLLGGAFAIVACGLAVRAGVGSFSLVTALLYVVAIAAAGNVRFDVGAGFTVPTQALFVPMLFALPPSLVPLLVPVALALGMAPQIVRGDVARSRLLTVPANSWFAIGPAAVLVLAGVHSPVGHWDVLVLALAAQFACDFAASVVRERIYGGVQFAELVEGCGPIYALDVSLSMVGIAIAYTAIVTQSQFAVLLVAPLFGLLRFFSRERHERLEQLAELNDAYQGTALLLGDVVEADDAYTGEHCKGVVQLSLAVAERLGLDADRKRNVEFGALLHDVGKITVPNEIINKPGRLNEREWAIIKTHTIEGQRMLEKIGGFMSEIGSIVRASHERWDGTGYPDGLGGEAIPLEARIVSVCDAFNAMTTTRSYREAMRETAAKAELERCAGTHFDPGVVGALLEVLAPATEALPLRAPASSADVALVPSAQSTSGSAPAAAAGPSPRRASPRKLRLARPRHTPERTPAGA